MCANKYNVWKNNHRFGKEKNLQERRKTERKINKYNADYEKEMAI